MKVEKLIIRDFRSHKLTKVTFTGGINLIVGQNGSGKSSLLDALLIGLYWPSKPKDLKKDDFMRIGGTSTEITLFIEKDGVKYQIHRNITRGLAFVKYYDGSWKALETGQKGVRDWVEKMIPYDVFLNAIYIRQGEIDAILESDESREKVVRQVLGLDRYENAYSNLLEVRREIERRIKSTEDYLKSTERIDELIRELEGELISTLREINNLTPLIPKLTAEVRELEEKVSQLDALQGEINSLRVELEKGEGELKVLWARMRELEKRTEEGRKRIGELEEKVKRARELENDAERYSKLSSFREKYLREKARIEKRMESYRASLRSIEDRLKELEEKKRKKEELEKEREELRKRLGELEVFRKEFENVKAITRNLEELKKKLKMTPEEIKELSREIEEARKRREEIQKEIESIKGRRGELRSQVSERNRAILELKKAKGKCPVCGSPLTEEHRKELLEKYRLEVKELSSEMKRLEARERELRVELGKVEDILKREKELISQREILWQVRELEGKLKGYELKALEKKAREYEDVKARLGRIEGELEGISREIGAGKSLGEKKAKLREELSRLEEELKKLEGELSSLGFSSLEELDGEVSRLEPLYKEYLRLKDSERELEREKARIKRLEGEIASLREEIREKEEKVRALREELSGREKAYDEKKHEEARKRLTALREELAGKKAKLDALEKRRDELKASIEKLRMEKVRRKEKEEELEKLRKARERVQELREKVKRFKALLREDALSEVGRIASEIFEELTEEKYSGVTVKAEDNRVKLGVVYDGKEYGLGFLSGGERIALGLAFRLALSLYLAGEMSLLILDEPTPYLDEERRRRLVDIMQRYLRKIPQVIVVSHDEELKDAADRVIRVTLENGVSKVSEVELGV